jgi:uncharacterized protein (DUF433 family)
LGATDATLVTAYPTLGAEDLVHAWAYVRAHRDEMDCQIRDHEVP